MQQALRHWSARLPFFYGWIIIAVAFVTMAIGVTGRTSFSLLMPPLIDEFKWDRGLIRGSARDATFTTEQEHESDA
jgi:hypothetical protein